MAGNCGGDLTGDWRITSSCVRTGGTAGVTACPSATVSGTVEITGTASYNADLTYSATLVMSGPQTVEVPASCLTQFGVTIPCSDLAADVDDVHALARAAPDFSARRRAPAAAPAPRP